METYTPDAILAQTPFPIHKLGDRLETIHRGYIQQWSFEPDQILLIRPRNLTPTGLDLTDLAHIPPTDHQKLPQTQLHPGDVIITLINPTHPPIATVYTLDRPANIPVTLARLHPHPTLNPHYLAQYLNAPIGQALLQARTTGNLTQTLSLADLTQLPIICPPRPIQDRIIAAIPPPSSHHTQPADTIEADDDRRSTASHRQFEQMLIEEHP